MDAAQAASMLDDAIRGVPMADFDERTVMQNPGVQERIPCKVIMEDDKACGQPAPRFGRYAGRCADHHDVDLENGENGRPVTAVDVPEVPVEPQIPVGPEPVPQPPATERVVELAAAIVQAKADRDAAEERLSDLVDVMRAALDEVL
jgi:hypothetical protein